MSGVIYAAIVAMWAAVLVPMWLRRHEANAETRSVEKFSTAMRTLSRRSPATPDRRYVLMPRRGDDGVSVHVSGAAAPAAEKARPPASPASARAHLLARRRRMLLALLSAVVLTMVLVGAGALPLLVNLLLDVVLVLYVMHLRAEAKRAASVARQRRRATAARRTRPAAGATGAAGPASGRASGSSYLSADTSVDEWAEPGSDVETQVAATGTETWEPVPVPPPTYTLKPSAPGVEYTPDREHDHLLFDTEPDEVVLDPEDVGLDELIDRRRAVGD